jgi:hypothetical protein
MIFLAFVLGIPLLLLVIAMVSGHIYRGGEAGLIDWQPTRSPETEVSLKTNEVDQLLAALNELRRRRGAPERSLEQMSAQRRGA